MVLVVNIVFVYSLALSLAYLLVLYLTGMEHTEYSTEVINLLQTHLQQGLIIKKDQVQCCSLF